ncbi:class I SAM-dependent methyltransferase [Roseobacter sp. A03A-229]
MTNAQKPEMSAATIYDAFAQKYRSYSETKSAYINAVDEMICDALDGQAGVVLDYGAGDGVRGAGLAARINPEEFYQADVSAEMITRCQSVGVAKEVFQALEANWSDDLPPINTILCLWNVLGHVPDTDGRRKLLADLNSLLCAGGRLFIDVNNRHYVGYGRLKVLGRRIIDTLRPDYSRGDVQFNWAIDGVDYPASGHFFTPAEMRDLLTTAGFLIDESKATDYVTGAISSDLTQGQLFFVARKPA